VTDSFNPLLGGRLRAARQQRGWSLGEIESLTEGEFKASVVGAYERGERSISVQRFVRLAEFYEVDPAGLLPPSVSGRAFAIDLDELASETGGELVDRYLAAIRWLRRKENPSEVREGDKAVIASLLGNSAERVLNSG
jgi:transcriptional regulator with XRE-family HTH domain